METQEVAIEVSAGPTFRAATPPPEVKEEESSGTYRPNATGAGAALFPEVAQSVVVGASLLELCNQKGALMNKRHTVLTPSGDAMREWLLKATPADMATRDRDGDTPLSVLCYHHDAPPFVLAFCDRGANPDVQNRLGFTPMILAAAKNRHKTVRALLHCRADPMINDHAGLNAMAHAARHSAYKTCHLLRDVGATSSLRKRRAGEGNQGGTTAVDGVGSAAVGGELEALASGGVCCAVL